MVPQAKTQIGIMNAVNKRKQSEIPSKPKDKFKCYSGIKGNWQTYWKPGSDLSKWYQRSTQHKKKPIDEIKDKLRTPVSSLFGIKEIIAVHTHK